MTAARLLTLFVGAAVFFPASAIAVQTSRTIVTDATSLLELGRRFESAGQTDRATRVYEGLTLDDRGDIRAEARYRLARMAIQRKHWANAAILLRRILDDRPDAAPARLTLAQVLAEIGDENAALRELRAVQSSGLPIEVARMVDRFSEALRARKPFGAGLEVALAPDTNINSATSRDSLGTVIGDFEIDPNAKGRSGVGVSLRGTAYARHPISDPISLLARVTTSTDVYRHKDANYVALDVGIGPELRLGNTRLNLEAGFARRWYGMKAYDQRLRAEVNGAVPIGRRSVARPRFFVSTVKNMRNDLQDGTIWGGEIGFERALGARSGIALSLLGERAALRDPAYSTTAWRGSVLGWRELGRATVHASASYGRLNADERFALLPERREDRYWRLGLGATMRQLQLNGFAPLIRFSIERNRSNVAFYDFGRRRAEFGFVRAF